MENIILTHQWKWITAGWFLLYGICLFRMLYLHKKNQKDVSLFAIAMLVILAFLWNPWLANYMIAHYMNNAKEFSRIGWSLLVTPVISYTLVQLVAGPGEEKRKAGTWLPRLVVAVALIYILGSQVEPYFYMPKNVYKLPEESLEVAEIIEPNGTDTNRENQNIGLLFTVGLGQETTACEDVFFGLRHYDASMIFSETSAEAMSENQETYDFVLGGLDAPEDELRALGYGKVGETTSCVVYKHL